jgi:ribosomal protein S18 acetylase RimI-like enzyme
VGSRPRGLGSKNTVTVTACRSASEIEQVVEVLRDAFHDYPVMRYVIGLEGVEYERRLRTLIEFFLQARVSRNEPVLGIAEDEMIVAAALVSLPGSGPPPAALATHRERVWRQLGADARARYEAFGAATQPFAIERPHHHLNMIGVRRSYAGRGLARRLLEAVHEMSREDPGSCGVTLTTELWANVGLYEHFGYRVTGHARVSHMLDTWGMFRADDG